MSDRICRGRAAAHIDPGDGARPACLILGPGCRPDHELAVDQRHYALNVGDREFDRRGIISGGGENRLLDLIRRHGRLAPPTILTGHARLAKRPQRRARRPKSQSPAIARASFIPPAGEEHPGNLGPPSSAALTWIKLVSSTSDDATEMAA